MARHVTSRRRALAGCKEGRHRYGPGVEAGGGIIRKTCRHCGALSIDLTAVAPSRKDGSLFERRNLSVSDG